MTPLLASASCGALSSNVPYSTAFVVPPPRHNVLQAPSVIEMMPRQTGGDLAPAKNAAVISGGAGRTRWLI
jgi:hypothetical protein